MQVTSRVRVVELNAARQLQQAEASRARPALMDTPGENAGIREMLSNV